MEVRSTYKYARISPFKAREVTREIQGLPVSAALDLLAFTPKKAAFLINKTLKSAIANAENNHNLDVDALVVAVEAAGHGLGGERAGEEAEAVGDGALLAKVGRVGEAHDHARHEPRARIVAVHHAGQHVPQRGAGRGGGGGLGEELLDLHVLHEVVAHRLVDDAEFDRSRTGVRPFNGVGFKQHPRGPRIGYWNWDMPGLETAVQVDGTINDNKDRDRGWTAEIRIPWRSLEPLAMPDGRALPPRDGDEWRMDFSRFNQYKEAAPAKDPGGWAWSPHGVWDSHIPELFTRVRFSTAPLRGR